MRILISNKIKIENYTDEALQYCRENLILPNPEFYKREAQGRWTGNTQREFVLFERIGHDLLLPFGCLKDLWRLFGGKIDFKPLFNPVEPRNYNSGINLYPYQETAVKRLLAAKNGILVSSCGSGKGLPLNAKIYTSTGWKYNGDLEIGDKVIGANGQETEVMGIYDKGEVPAYKLTFSDGVQVICDKDHLWAVQTQSQRSDGKGFYTVNAQSIFYYYAKAKLQGRRNFEYYIPVVEPVQFKKKQVPIDGWLLGFLIGDGCLRENCLTISNSEKDLIDKAEKKVCKQFRKINDYDYYIPKTSLNAELRDLGLIEHRSYEKFIPDLYKYNDINTRLSVLQGLFDSDGNVSKGQYEYATSSKQLADDFVEIVQSLGGTAKIVKRTPHYAHKGEYKQGRTSYRVHFKLYKFKPFTSLKHASKYQERVLYTQAYRIIKEIEPCKPIISRCITVSAKDELYVTDNFVVTHNTQMALETIARIGGKALWLTHTSELLQQSLERAKSCFDLPKDAYGTITAGKVNIGTHITFATVQTMRELDLRQYAKEWDVVMVDECFTKGTKILTQTGYKEVQSLNTYDIIASYNRETKKIEYKPIVNIFKHKAKNIVKIKLTNKKEIICTANHPIFTKDRGYVNASDLRSDDYVMFVLQERDRRNKTIENGLLSKQKTRVGLLQPGMCEKKQNKFFRRSEKENIGKNVGLQQGTPSRDCGTNEAKQSYVEPRSAQKSFGKIKSNGALSENTMRKWGRIDSPTTDIDVGISQTYGSLCRISHTDKNGTKSRVSDLLQSRYCDSRQNDSNRDRRKFTYGVKKATTRQEENRFFEWIRVDCVTFQEQTSDGTYGGLCSDGYVYNIEVADNNNYFANGVLVHNCHKAVGSPTKVMQFYKVLSNLSARFKFGVTATPKRSDGLERCMFALLGDIVHTIPKKEVKQYTCPVKVKKVETGYSPNLDFVLAGDGTIVYSDLINDLTENTARNEKIASDIQTLLNDKPNARILILSDRVAHLTELKTLLCKNMAQQSIQQLMALSNSKKQREARRQVLKDLNDGKINVVLATYALAKEGLDVPTLDYVVFASPQKDPTTVEQSAGRVGRKADGKDFGTVIDYVDDFGMLKGFSKKRNSVYKKLEYEVL